MSQTVRGGSAAGDMFRALLEAAPEARVIVDDAGVIRLINAQTARALAKTGMPPSRLMQALDTFVADLPDREQLVTCCYLVIDPDAGEVTICSAGHLPVLLIGPDASVGALPAPIGVPLGVGRISHQQVDVPVSAGSTLVLYTDGLVETPRSDIDVQLDRLRGALRSAFTGEVDLENAADLVLAAFHPDTDGHADDVTLLLARLPEAPLAAASVVLGADPVAVSGGRGFVRATLREWDCATEVLDSACLLASEVLTNAVQHARGPLTLRLHRGARDVTVEVTDGSARIPQRRIADAGDESGRGLLLVDALADSWGTRSAGEGKTVWFTLPLDAAGSRDEAEECPERAEGADRTGSRADRYLPRSHAPRDDGPDSSSRLPVQERPGAGTDQASGNQPEQLGTAGRSNPISQERHSCPPPRRYSVRCPPRAANA